MAQLALRAGSFEDHSDGGDDRDIELISDLPACERLCRSMFRERVLNAGDMTSERECDLFGFFHRHVLTLSAAQRLGLATRLNKDVDVLSYFVDEGSGSRKRASLTAIVEILFFHEIPAQELAAAETVVSKKVLIRLNAVLDLYMAFRSRVRDRLVEAAR